MHIHNTTLVCSDNDLPALLGFLRSEVIPVLLEEGLAASPRLARVISSLPGASEDAESVSLQFEFGDMASLAGWKKRHLPRGLEALNRKFGQNVLVFSTVLQQLPHA